MPLLKLKFRNIWKRLASPNLALVLLGALTLAIIAGGTLPQFGRLSTAELGNLQLEWPLLSLWLIRTGLADIYSSWWFAALYYLLLVNLLAGTAWHVTHIRAWLRGNAAPKFRLDAPGLPPPQVSSQFSALHDKRSSQVLIQGAAGLWGTPLLHLGVIVVIVAAVLSGSERFGAHVELAEGEVFFGQKSKLIEDRFSSGQLEGIGSLRLDRMQIEVIKGTHLSDLQAHFTIQEGKEAPHAETLSINHPLKVGKYKIYLDKNFGQTAIFDRILADGSQRQMLVNFNVPRGKWGSGEALQRDTLIELDNIPILYRMELTPGDSPGFQLKAEQRDKTVFEGALAPGQMADLGAYQLIFTGTAPWVGLYLTTDWAVPIVFAGFVIALAGFLLHLLVRPRRLQLAIRDEGWELRGWSLRDDWQFEKQWREWQADIREGVS